MEKSKQQQQQKYKKRRESPIFGCFGQKMGGSEKTNFALTLMQQNARFS